MWIKRLWPLLLLGLALLAIRWLPEPGPRGELAGLARVTDGDSLVLGGERVRLKGIDAPELDQLCGAPGRRWPCGRRAALVLRRLTGHGMVRCRISGADRYGRQLGHCHAGKTDLNRTMVEKGWAVAYGDYRREERVARAARLGVWRGPFVAPRAWRELHRR
jgi:endonuclease YncB( thermonuclease family)